MYVPRSGRLLLASARRRDGAHGDGGMDRLTGSRTVLCYAPFVVAGLGALIAGFGPAEFQRRELYDAYGPGVVALVLAIAAGIGMAAFVQWLRTMPSVSWGDVLRLIALAGAFLVVASAVPGRMRIQADEYLLASTAYRLQLDGSAQFIGTGFVSPGGQVEAVTQGHDKRGLLYPMTVAALHRARGYSPANSIHVNLAFGLIGVLLAYAVVRSAAQPLAAFIAALLLATHPLHVWAARSGGMELVNLVLLLAGLVLV
ncbi:MAG TPA: hypothetical protein VND91_12760, partial [Candidatus Saccharimonadia bacterium]|nr:hypothetical protein [Candidatus Saccharimonadia bacterium]